MLFADVAELADALDLGSSVTDVGVQVPSSAPYRVFLQNFKVFVCHSVFLLFFQYEDFQVSGNPTTLWIYRKQKPLVNKGISPLFRAVFFLIIYERNFNILF